MERLAFVAGGGTALMLVAAAVVLALPRPLNHHAERSPVQPPPPPVVPVVVPPVGETKPPAVVQVAPALPASAKPSRLANESRPIPKRDSALPVKPVPPTEVAPPPVVKILVKRRRERSEEEMIRQVAKAPVVALDTTTQRAESAAVVRAAERAAAAGRTKDDAPLALHDRRPDLAGLPFRRGAACRLSDRDAAFLDEGSKALRIILAPDRFERLTGEPEEQPKFHQWLRPESVPALMQILMAQPAPFRVTLIDQLSRIRGTQATEALAQLALFDLHPRVRERATEALRDRPSTDYCSILLEGFAHPWPAVADHAAEALVALQRRDAVPALLHLLDRPDPRAPYQKAGGKGTYVREMVRVNHLRNCLLCHPPSFDEKDMVRGIVPETHLPLVSPITGVGGYFGSGISETDRRFVRADITYLKQDFSTMLPVAKHEIPVPVVAILMNDIPTPWPSVQRFDFLVRERLATQQDLLECLKRKQAGPSAHLESLFFALRELTDEDPGSTVAAWKKHLLGRHRDARQRYRGFSAASALAVDATGRAFVIDENRSLLQEGITKAEEWLRPQKATRWVGLAHTPDGRLLATRANPSDLASIDRDKKKVKSLASAVLGKPLVAPRRMAADGHGGVYFTEDPGPEGRGVGVLYLSARGTVSRTNALPGLVRGLGLSPSGDTLYVAQGAELRGYPVESAGLLGTWRPVGRLTPRGGLARAVDLAVDDNGLIHVLNGPAQQVEVFGPDGASLPGARFPEPPIACVARGETLYVLTRKALFTVALTR